MRCHYEVLNVPKDADLVAIKAAYKKMALKWHPDKNLDNPEHAKEQFQLIQQAYEILSDHQERAWYDKHREQILRGANSGYEDNCLDVYQYFTTTCFKGYGDDENGFYTVYRNVFEKIAKEDMEYMENKNEFCDIPMFGDSQSDYDQVVKPFYDYWMSYSTKKSYTWLDPYDIKQVHDRRSLKLIEKENKKVRQKAKKERNEEVRALVTFVRKRDKRVQENAKRMEAKKLENKEKQEKLKRLRILERREEICKAENKEAEWAKFDNLESELKEIEKNLADQFSDEQLTNSEGESCTEDEEEPMDDLYCAACNKMFKTPKTFKNHELSKKHRDNVLILKSVLLSEEEQEDNLDLDEENGSALEFSDDLGKLEVPIEDKPKVKNKKKNRKSGRTIMLALSDSSDVEIDNVELKDSSVSVLLEEEDDGFNDRQSKSKNKKGKKKVPNKDKLVPQDTSTNSELDTAKAPKPKETVKQQFKTAEEIVEQLDTNHCCVSCRSNFPSKNKLFEHLKKTGHSIYLPSNNGRSKSKKKNVREK